MLLGALLGASCLKGVAVPAPEVQGTQSLLWIQDFGGNAPKAIFLPAGQAPQTLDVGRSLHVLAFDWSPLGLVELGVPFEPEASGPTQPLPAPLAAFRLNEQLDLEAADVSGLLASFVLPLPDIEACAAQGGCLARQGPHRCMKPCDESQPAPPEPVSFDCPSDWPSEPGPPGSGLTLCAPEVHPWAACETGTFQGFGADCRAMVECDSGTDPWPTPPAGEGPVLYVDAGAPPGGDGSMARPFRTLAEATSIPNARVLLAPGDYLSPDTFGTTDLQLAARCPSATRLLGASDITVSAGTLALRGVQVHMDVGPLLVSANASLTLDGVTVSAGQSGLSILGSLDARQVKLQAPLGLLVRGGQAHLDGADIEGEQAVACRSGTLSAHDLRTQGHGAPFVAVSMNGCQSASLSRVHLEGAQTGILVYRPGVDLAVEDAVIRNMSEDGILLRDAATATVASRLRLERILAEDLGFQGILLQAANTYANQLVIRRIRDTALDLRQNPRLSSQMFVQNLWATGSSENVARLGHAPGAGAGIVVTGGGWVVASSPTRTSRGGTLMLRDGGTAQLSGIYVHGNAGKALTVSCGHGWLEDLVIQGGDEVAVEARPDDQLILRRVEIRAPTLESSALRSTGILLETNFTCGRAPTVLKDVFIEGCSEGCGTGVKAVPSTELQAENLRIQGFAMGVDTRLGGQVQLVGGGIIDNRVGWSAPDLGNLHDSLRGVRLDNVRNLSSE